MDGQSLRFFLFFVSVKVLKHWDEARSLSRTCRMWHVSLELRSVLLKVKVREPKATRDQRQPVRYPWFITEVTTRDSGNAEYIRTSAEKGFGPWGW